jgi:electron transfer flavoprotein beta subunit
VEVDLNIIACVKQTPDTAAALQVSDTHVTWGESPLIVNPWDEYAIEEALLLREQYGGKATAISMGPESAKDALRTCLAVGCDESILVSDPALKGSDVTATAYALAKAIEKAGDAGLALLGRQAIDGDTGLTAAQLARHLGWTLLSQVIRIVALDAAAGTIKVERLMDEGRQVCTASLPAVISVVKGINEPRYPSFMGIRKASKANIPLWSASDLGLDGSKVGAGASAISWPEIYPMPVRESKVEMIAGDNPEQIAAGLVDRILAEKII